MNKNVSVMLFGILNADKLFLFSKIVFPIEIKVISYFRLVFLNEKNYEKAVQCYEKV